jgi:aspartyl/asparaginyl beta-hydroxylase (cupin superfamily)
MIRDSRTREEENLTRQFKKRAIEKQISKLAVKASRIPGSQTPSTHRVLTTPLNPSITTSTKSLRDPEQSKQTLAL